MPLGVEVTVPAPLPVVTTDSVNWVSVNVAATIVALVSVITHVPVPEQPPPLQPLNVEPVAGVAVSVTDVPKLYGSEQSLPQLIPAGDDVTVPTPLPARVAVSVYE